MFAALTIIIVVQAVVIFYMAYDRSYGCLTRAAFNILYPVLKTLGYSFLFGDVDHFKAFNSQYGHEAVNAMVKAAIRAFLRSGDIVFRIYSGDEFIIATRSKDTDTIIARLCATFATHTMTLTVEPITDSLDTASVKLIARKNAR